MPQETFVKTEGGRELDEPMQKLKAHHEPLQDTQRQLLDHKLIYNLDILVAEGLITFVAILRPI